MTITVLNHMTLDGVMQGPDRKDEPLPWPNSTLLRGDLPDAVAALKADQPDGQLTIVGSRSLPHALMERQLIDEWLLMIHPVVLDSGLRLFSDGVQTPPWTSSTRPPRPPA